MINIIPKPNYLLDLSKEIYVDGLNIVCDNDLDNALAIFKNEFNEISED